jgi:hypothetical protein
MAHAFVPLYGYTLWSACKVKLSTEQHSTLPDMEKFERLVGLVKLLLHKMLATETNLN